MSIVEKIKKYIKDNESDPEAKIILYGAGLVAHRIYNTLMEKYGINVDLFCTSYEPEHTDKKTGITVLNRESLSRYKKALVIFALGITFSDKQYEEVKEYIMSKGIPEDNIIFKTNDWIISQAKPYMDKNGKLSVFTVSYHVTKQCNLKCRMCGELLFGPVKRRSFPPEQIIADTDTLFEIVDHIEILKLIGGEVMTYSRLDELITYLNKYADHIGLLELYTNGAVVPKESLLDAIRGYKGNIQITISDYGDLSIAKDNWIEFGKMSDIRINVLGYAGEDAYKAWIDCTKIYDLKETERELEEKFCRCGQRLDYVLEDSILGKCTSYHMYKYALGLPIKDDECLYINEDISIEEKKKRVLQFGSDDKYLDVCKYCIWGATIRDTLERYPAAEQMDEFPK